MRGLALSLTAGALALVSAGPISAQPPPAAPGPDFNGVIRPILQTRCVSCHGPTVQQGGLRLDDREAALRGASSGPVIKPGDADGSPLFQMVATRRMPLDDELSVLEREQLRAWINAGARWPEKRVIPNLVFDDRVDAYRVALRNQDRGQAARLAADPALLKARDKAGSTLLHHAVIFGGEADVRQLLDRGAAVDAVNLEGVTPLIWAVRNEAIAGLLIERGADVNAMSDAGVTPLVAAAGLARGAPTVRRLIEKGARPTPPQQVAMSLNAGSAGGVETVKLLFPGVISPNGPAAAAALANAVIVRDTASVDYLLAQGARGETLNDALVAAANASDAALVKRLLDLGAGTTGSGPQGAGPLIAAVLTHLEPAEKVRLLIAAGADVNRPDAHGRTPLSFARQIRPELVPALTAAGAR